MAVPAIPDAGKPWLTWAQGIDTEARKVADKADTTDPRLTDARTPVDGSVTNAKVAGNAAISADKLTDGTTGKVLTAAERAKLAGVAAGATVNSPDDVLVARGNHTGTQDASTVTGLATVATSGTYADLSGKPAIPATPADIGAQPAGSYVGAATAAQQKIGDGADPNASTTQNVKLLITANRTNPDKVIEQHLVGYSFYSGTPSPGVGTLQGGSCESYAFANGGADMSTVLGFEGVGRGDGDNAARKVSTIIGLQGTALNRGVVGVDLLVGIRARGISGGGTGTVAEARSLDVQEPTVGTAKYSAYVVGRTRIKRSASGGNALELVATTDKLSWTWAGQVQQGYASDGSSIRLTMDAQDTPTAGRVKSELFGSGKHVSLLNNSSEVVSFSADGTLTLGGGQLKYGNASNQTTGGGSAALGANSPAVTPAAPSTWWKVTLADGSQGFIPVWK